MNRYRDKLVDSIRDWDWGDLVYKQSRLDDIADFMYINEINDASKSDENTYLLKRFIRERLKHSPADYSLRCRNERAINSHSDACDAIMFFRKMYRVDDNDILDSLIEWNLDDISEYILHYAESHTIDDDDLKFLIKCYFLKF